MRPYEVMVILDAGLEDDAIRSVVDRAVDLVSSRGGDVRQVEHWGRRRLAYELKHRWEAYYVLIRARAEPAVVADVDRVLSLADEVIRHKVIRIPEAVAAREWAGTAPPEGAGGRRQLSVKES